MCGCMDTGGPAWSLENTWDPRLVSEPQCYMTCSGGGEGRRNDHITDNNNDSQDCYLCPGRVAQLVVALSHTPKVGEFNPWSGHIPRLWVHLWSG